MDASIQSPSTTTQPQRSTFITVLAWIFIVFTGLTVLVAILQNVMFSFFLNDDFLSHDQDASGYFQILIRGVLIALLLFSALTLWASVSLLKRKNWARIFFIVLMVLSLLHSVVSLLFTLFSPMPPNPEGTQNVENLNDIFLTLRIGLSIFTALLAVLWGWILKKLLSPEIRQEFLTNVTS